jgi:hypothetical protein
MEVFCDKTQARDFLESCIDNLKTQKDAIEAELEVARSKKKNNKVDLKKRSLCSNSMLHCIVT